MEGSGWHCAVGQGDGEVTSDLWLLSTFSSTLPSALCLPPSFPFPLSLSPPFTLPTAPPFLPCPRPQVPSRQQKHPAR